MSGLGVRFRVRVRGRWALLHGLVVLAVVLPLMYGAVARAASPVTYQSSQSSFGDLVVDDANQEVFDSAPSSNEVLVFDFNGSLVATLQNLPGADGMVIEGSTLYVAESTAGAIEAFDLATLVDEGPVATGLSFPQQLVFAGGELWAAVGSNIESQIASVSLGGTVTTFPTEYYYGPALATSPTTPDVLYIGDGEGGQVDELDVSTGSPVLIASGSPTEDPITELAVSPDGTRVIPANDDGEENGEIVELDTATLATDGIDYPITGAPDSEAVAVSPGDGGLVALGLEDVGVDQSNIEVFNIGDPSLAYGLSTGSTDGQSNDMQDVMPNGLALSADASKAFAVVATNIYRTDFNFVILDLQGTTDGEPVEIAGPSISGTPEVGQTLQVNPGSWQGASSFSYSWWECRSGACSPADDYSSTFVATALNTGYQLYAYVTATNSVGSETTYTADTAPIVEPVPSLTTIPSISGVAQVGDTLTASPGAWTNSPTGYEYQWFRSSSSGWIAIVGAAGNVNSAGAGVITYVPTDSDQGNSLEVQITAVNYGGAGSPALSDPTDVVAGSDPEGGQTTSTPQTPTVPELTGTPTISTASIKASLSRVLKPSGKKASIATVLKRHGYAFRFEAPAEGTLNIVWTATIQHKKVTVGEVTIAISQAGTVTIMVRLTASGARDLRRNPDMPITARSTFKTSAHRQLSETAKFTFRDTQ